MKVRTSKITGCKRFTGKKKKSTNTQTKTRGKHQQLHKIRSTAETKGKIHRFNKNIVRPIQPEISNLPKDKCDERFYRNPQAQTEIQGIYTN